MLEVLLTVAGITAMFVLLARGNLLLAVSSYALGLLIGVRLFYGKEK